VLFAISRIIVDKSETYVAFLFKNSIVNKFFIAAFGTLSLASKKPLNWKIFAMGIMGCG
jgi:hypothetical protein